MNPEAPVTKHFIRSALCQSLKPEANLIVRPAGQLRDRLGLTFRAPRQTLVRVMIKPWNKISSRDLGEFKIFNLRADRKISPRTQAEHDFFVIDCANWVNVVALTPDQKIVMVEQYRHGSNTVELEIPGGMIDAKDASPVTAGVRELREETGYEGKQARLLGEIFPNPAIMSNVCYTVLVEDCRLTHPVEFDSGEDIITHLVPVAELPRLVAEKKIGHSLVAVALYHLELWQRGLKSTAA